MAKPAAQCPVEQISGKRKPFQPRFATNAPALGREPCYILSEIQHLGTGRNQFGSNPWKELLQDLQATGQKSVEVFSLRHSSARLWYLRQFVLFENDDRRKLFSKHSGCQHPSHTCADHDSVTHVKSPVRRIYEPHRRVVI